MLTEMTPQQLIDWRAYSLIEPFSDVRSDYHAALICKTIWDVNRDTKKHPEPLPLEPFLLEWAKDFAKIVAAAPTNEQTFDERTRNLTLWALALAGGATEEQQAQIEANIAANRAAARERLGSEAV